MAFLMVASVSILAVYGQTNPCTSGGTSGSLLSAPTVAGAPYPTAYSTCSGGGPTLSLQLSVCGGCVVFVQFGLSPVGSYPSGNSAYTCANGQATCAVLNSLTGTGLSSFQSRYTYTAHSGSGDEMWYWTEWATASASTTSTTITANTTCVNNGAQTCAVPNQPQSAPVTMIAISVANSNPSSPFDTGINPQASQDNDNDCNPTDHCTIEFSTASAPDLVVAGLLAQGGSSTAPTPPPTYTSAGYTYVNQWIGGALSFNTYASPQTNTPTGSWTNISASASWYADAFAPCISSCSTTSTTNSSTSTTTISTSTSTSVSTSSTSSVSSSSSISSSTSTQQTTYTTFTCTYTATVVNGALTGLQSSISQFCGT